MLLNEPLQPKQMHFCSGDNLRWLFCNIVILQVKMKSKPTSVKIRYFFIPQGHPLRQFYCHSPMHRHSPTFGIRHRYAEKWQLCSSVAQCGHQNKHLNAFSAFSLLARYNSQGMDEEISWIIIIWTLISLSWEKFQCVFCGAIKCYTTLSQEVNPEKIVVDSLASICSKNARDLSNIA